MDGFIISMEKLKPEEVTPGLAELAEDVPKEVEVLLLAQWVGVDVVSCYGVRLTAPAFGQRDSMEAIVVLRPNLDVDDVQAVFSRADGFQFPFKADSVAYHEIDAKKLIGALCVDAPFDGVFALVDRICKGMLDGGDDGAELSRLGIRKVSQSVVNYFLPAIRESVVHDARCGYVTGSLPKDVAVQELILAGYDFGAASRLVKAWKDLKSARERIRWEGIK
jgi:hypothetical protein